MIGHQDVGVNLATMLLTPTAISQGKTGNPHRHKKSRYDYCRAQSDAAADRDPIDRLDRVPLIRIDPKGAATNMLGLRNTEY